VIGVMSPIGIINVPMGPAPDPNKPAFSWYFSSIPEGVVAPGILERRWYRRSQTLEYLTPADQARLAPK